MNVIRHLSSEQLLDVAWYMFDDMNTIWLYIPITVWLQYGYIDSVTHNIDCNVLLFANISTSYHTVHTKYKYIILRNTSLLPFFKGQDVKISATVNVDSSWNFYKLDK